MGHCYTLCFCIGKDLYLKKTKNLLCKFNAVLKENKVKDEMVCVQAVWEVDCRLRI